MIFIKYYVILRNIATYFILIDTYFSEMNTRRIFKKAIIKMPAKK